MIDRTISHYAPKAHPRFVAGALARKRPQADKILEKLGEVPIRLNLAFPPYLVKLSSFVELSIPPFFGGSGIGSSGL